MQPASEVSPQIARDRPGGLYSKKGRRRRRRGERGRARRCALMHPSPLRLPPTCAYATRGATEDEEEAAAWEGRGVRAPFPKQQVCSHLRARSATSGARGPVYIIIGVSMSSRPAGIL